MEGFAFIFGGVIGLAVGFIAAKQVIKEPSEQEMFRILAERRTAERIRLEAEHSVRADMEKIDGHQK